MSATRPRIVISWMGLPYYAARLIRQAIVDLGEPIAVIGSKPNVPIQGMEEALGQSIIWIDEKLPTTWASLNLPVPEVYFQSGWSYPGFRALGQQVKAQGGRVIGCSDANWRGDMRQLVLGFLAFRLSKKREFDGMIVPGRQAIKLMRYYGFAESQLKTGLYGADPERFNGGAPLKSRAKTFLFVGQFIERKNVVQLATAFSKLSADYPDWTLRIIGAGVQRPLIPVHPRITVENFLQPVELVSSYRATRYVVMPSLTDAWPLVVHEAISCGCKLILSDQIGNAPDLTNAQNCLTFPAGNVDALETVLRQAVEDDADALDTAESESRRLAQLFGPHSFAAAVSGFAR